MRPKKRSFQFIAHVIAFVFELETAREHMAVITFLSQHSGGPRGIGNFDQWTCRVNKQSTEILFLTVFASVTEQFKHRRRFAKQC